MTFDLHIHGETPEELLDALTHLGGTTNIITPAPQPQSEPVAQPDKPKAPAPAKQKKTAQKAAAAPAEEPANPTHTPAQNTDAPAAPAQFPTTTTQADASTSPAEPDPATLDKIRDLARSLIVHGRRAEVQQIIKSTGAASISKLPPESYTAVREQLVNLSSEVDNDAAG